MGKKNSISLFAKNKNKNKRDFDSFSDDYRLSPEICNEKCCSYQGPCPEGQICCSRETCLPNLRGRGHGHSLRSASPSPKRNFRKPDERRNKYVPRNRMTRNGVDVIVLSDKHLDIRKSSCSSCSSCGSCSSEDSHFTRVELRNDLFTSPLQSTQASSFYKESPSSFHQRKEAEERGRLKEDRKKRIQPYTGELKGSNKEPPARRGRKRRDDSYYSPAPPRRARSYSGCSSGTSGSLAGGSEAGHHNQNFVQQQKRVKAKSPEQKYKQRNPKSPSREGRRGRNVNQTDSGIERGGKTSISSGVGTESSGGSNSNKAKPAPKEGRQASRSPQKKAPHIKESELLNKMVNQTREHRKQIKSLENELERLRVTGDTLASSEVSAKDVEWRPGDVLGEGSFSTVYKGTYCGTEIAVKELKFKLSQDDKNYFRSEAALLQQLHHPRIVLLMGICTTSSRPFMLLEYLSGGTLHTLIHTSTKERIDHAIYFIIAKDIAQGMNFLHKHDPQVLHLDLKSMNVLLDGYTRVKIADFGFSILRRSHGASSAMQRGTIRGTPAWMAPELLTKGEVSPKCDVYSYAIILWEMLTTSHPFEGLDVYQIMENLENGSRPALPVAGLSIELRELITSCWAQNHSLRPSFEEVLGALETASLPVSWKTVLYKANILPSALTDVTTARTVIDIVQRSIEMLDSSQLDKGRKQPFIQDIPNRNKLKKVNQQVMQALPDQRTQPTSPSYARKAARSNERFQGESHGRLENPNEMYRKSPTRERRALSPRRLNPDAQKVRRNGTYHPGIKVRKPNEEPPALSRRRSHIESPRVRNRSPHKVSPTRQSRRSKYLESDLEDDRIRQRYISRERYRDENYNRSYQYTEGETNASELSYDDGPSQLWTSTDELSYQEEGSDELHNHLRRQSPTRKYSHSPTRRVLAKQQSPHQNGKHYPTSHDREDIGRRDGQSKRHSSSPMRYGAIVVTSEQLLNQKQRLRPVRPSALRDLAHLPQSSLKDLSFILKRAIRQRRDAIDDPQSGRDLPRSDIDWSDWY